MTSSTYWSSRHQVGAAAGTNVTATEGLPSAHTKLALAATPVTITHATGAGYGSLKIYDFPVGRIQLLDAEFTLDLTAGANISATATVHGSLGTAANANATLAGAEVNIVPDSNVTLSSSAGTLTGECTNVELAAGLFNGTTTAVDLYLNFAVPSGVTNNSTLTCTGTVAVTWINHGDV